MEKRLPRIFCRDVALLPLQAVNKDAAELRLCVRERRTVNSIPSATAPASGATAVLGRARPRSCRKLAYCARFNARGWLLRIVRSIPERLKSVFRLWAARPAVPFPYLSLETCC